VSRSFVGWVRREEGKRDFPILAQIGGQKSSKTGDVSSRVSVTRDQSANEGHRRPCPAFGKRRRALVLVQQGKVGSARKTVGVPGCRS
jgi:hypothetical protein